METDPYLEQLSRKYIDSQKTYQEAESIYAELIAQTSIKKDLFFATLCLIKSKISAAVEMLEVEKPKYTFCAQYADTLRDYIDQIKQKELLFSGQLSRLLSPEAHRLHLTPAATEANSRTVVQRLTDVRKHEVEFLHQIDSIDQQHFISMVKEYFDLSCSLKEGILHYLQEPESDSKVYIQLTTQTGFTSHVFKLLPDTYDADTAFIIHDIAQTMQKVIEDYENAPENTDCLNSVTSNLKALAKRHNFKQFELNLEGKLQSIVGPTANIQQLFGKVRGFLNVKSPPKIDASVYLQVFHEFCRILIELEFDKPEKVLQINEYYQYAFLLFMFRTTVKCMIVHGLEAALKR